ncbi:MAG: glycoside hydrolase family 3 C-terminal domain-containing protein, partial [Clostridia bacterium]|nr:glycoside hydrolase family 3 C-terminal domain-containing protein [Clostridia bacterium]
MKMNFEQRARELVSKMTLDEKIAQMRHEAPAIERLGIPAYNWWSEALHGAAREGCATVFPQAIGLAASFNTDLMYDVADVTSTEARAKFNEYKKFGYTLLYQGITECSPNINIFRDPRWGRGQETYGEDPYLTGRMGTAFVRGLQGNGKYRKCDATLKHFAVHSGPESLRHGFDAKVTDDELYNTYLWAFKYCIDNADPTAIMGAYNRVNGEPASGSRTLSKVVFEDWGYKGFMMSDMGSIGDIHMHHKYTKDEVESSALALECGCLLNIGDSYVHLKEAVERGIISEETITHAVEVLFASRIRLGMFDNDCEYDNIPYEVIECDEHRAINRKMAEESIVLLKNDGILPIKDKKQTIAVIGPVCDDVTVLLGNYNGTPSRYTTLLRGIQEAAEGRVIYARGSNLLLPAGRDFEKPLNEAIIAAKKADIVIMCMGLNPSCEGEESDAANSANNGDRDTIQFPETQMELMREVMKVGKPTVFVNVSGSCMNLDFADKNCNAVLQCFYPGAEGG